MYCGGTSRPDSTDHRDRTRNDGLSWHWRKALGYCSGTTTLRGDQGVLTVGREERNCGVVGTRSKERGMAMAGEGTPPTIESSENRAEPTWLLVAVFPRTGKTGGPQWMWAA